MSNILFIVGLPCSGKTHLAEKINKDNNYKYIIIDDPKDFSEIESHLESDLIITDPNLIFPENRENAIKRITKLNPNCKIDWLFFENNPDRCLINYKIRGSSKKVESFIKNFSKYYTIPKNSNIVKVWEG